MDKVQVSWWIDGDMSLDNKLMLRKKLAEFLQVTVNPVENMMVTAWIPVDQVSDIVLATLKSCNVEGDGWIWIAFNCDKAKFDKVSLAKEIVTNHQYSVYSFTTSSHSLFVEPDYEDWRQQILGGEIPVFCLAGPGSLHDGKPKVMIIFAQGALIRKVFLDTGNQRYGYIIKKELEQDSRLANELRVSVGEADGQVVLELIATRQILVERAIAVVYKKLKNFKISVTNSVQEQDFTSSGRK